MGEVLKPGAEQIPENFESLLKADSDLNLDQILKESTDDQILAQGAGDSLSLYLREIHQFPLLDPQTTSDLFWKMQTTPENSRELEHQVAQGNLRLVVAVAKKYQGRGLPLIDLIQEGNIGLLRAIPKFEVERNLRFSTYAIWWIRQGIIRSIEDKARIIRIPFHVQQAASKVLALEECMTQQLQRDPKISELQEEVARRNLSSHALATILSGTMTVDSLDKPIGEDETQTLADFQPAEGENPEGEAVHTNIHEYLLERMSLWLDNREMDTLLMHFGINFPQDYNFEKIKHQIGVKSRQHVKQIEDKALAKLRSDSLLQELTLA